MALGLIVGLICGVVCALVASSKGRNPVGWFFVGFLIGVFGLILVLVISNLKEEKSRHLSIEQENRRLREQIRQEQIKAETFRTHAQSRLDAHDQHLGIDTRAGDRLLAGSAPVAGLLETGNSAYANAVAQPVSGTSNWYYSIEGQIFGPISAARMVHLLGLGTIPRSALVWIEGMADWVPTGRVPEFNAVVNS